jgi:aspartyl-tRNA(Asn)/glutamyl-tRNA(Gln) amidotransferase subunit A
MSYSLGMIDPRFSIESLRSQLQQGQISSREAVSFFLERIERYNARINVIVSSTAEAALEQARVIDDRRARGESLGPLAGVPIVVKDILCTRNGKTTCGSRILENYVSPFDAHVVEQLERAGAIVLAKTNLDEFAMGGSTENSIFGASRNPWDTTRTCGGSSGGSAAAIAAAFAPAAIGTDTGGSIRQPAAFCGVCGIKPTYGRVSRYGLIAYGSSLDVAGVFAHSVSDLAVVLETIAGHDPRDSTSLPNAVTPYSSVLNERGAGPRIGVVREHIESPGLDSELRQSLLAAIEVYRGQGAEIVDISLPHSKYCIPTYYIIAPCEASSNLSRYDGAHFGFRAGSTEDGKGKSLPTVSPLDAMYERTRSEGFGPEVRRRILLGTYALSAGYYDAYYLKALKVRRLIRQDYDQAFEKVDVILGPTTPTPAFRLGEKVNDPVQLYLEDLFTVGANLAGIPALSIPIGRTQSGLPLGMQLQAPPLQESSLLAAGHLYQIASGYQPSIPPDFAA